MILDRDSLLQAMELKKENVTIGDGEVIVSEIGASDMIDLYTRKDLHDENGDMIISKFTPALVVMAVVGENGERLFSDADIPLLEKAPASQLGKLADVARKLNGLKGDETKN